MKSFKKEGGKKRCQVKVIVIEMYIDFDKSKTDHEVDVFNFACYLIEYVYHTGTMHYSFREMAINLLRYSLL